MIHINISCDHSGRGRCVEAIGVTFHHLTETYGDVVAGLRGIGWHVETDGNSRQARCLCPEHAPR